MKTIYFLVILLLIGELVAQTDSVNVKFIVYTTDRIADSSSIYVAGNNPQFGSWSPGKVMLTRLDDTTFLGHFKFAQNESLEFKFTRGSWSNEAVSKGGKILKNHTLRVANDTVLTFNISHWKDEFEYEVQGQITGEVNYIEQIKTRDELLPRDVIIWTPPNYHKNFDQSYPVLYMHDGQNIVDPATSSFGVDWQVDETADSLISNNIIEPIIIVGIYSTDNRFVEYSENDTGYAYIDFIVEDLKPLIDTNYRTKPDRINTAIAGSSMGGLISFMAAWERPEIFSKAACLSPAFKIRNFDFVDNVQSYSGVKKEIQLYIDNGGVGLEDSLQYGIDEMLNALHQKGVELGKI
ncbi:MAG: alpha/beta hydrolase-fold protein [Melioribacteraceae bacterium]|nr:alpha/beta hydrolase-fold protein [Melioribacteraceae bacterium]